MLVRAGLRGAPRLVSVVELGVCRLVCEWIRGLEAEGRGDKEAIRHAARIPLFEVSRGKSKAQRRETARGFSRGR